MDLFNRPHPLQLDFSKPPRRNNVLRHQWRACYRSQRNNFDSGRLMSMPVDNGTLEKKPPEHRMLYLPLLSHLWAQDDPARIGGIHVLEGQPVRTGELLVDVDTLMLSLDFEAPCDCIVRRVLISSGQSVRVGDAMFEIEI